MVGEEKKNYAKSENQKHGWIENKEHLAKVSELAGEYGDVFGKRAEASLAGLFHDFGKYSERFQGVLEGKEKSVDHAFPGAAFLCYNYPVSGNGGNQCPDYVSVIESVAGHHDGLVSLNSMKQSLKKTYCDDKADCCPSKKRPSLHGEKEFEKAKKAFSDDFREYKYEFSKPQLHLSDDKVENMLDTRMLFSCLVDADYSVSASDDDPEYQLKSTGRPIDAETALTALENHRAEIKKNSTADANLNMIRDLVYESCGNAGDLSAGLFTLTAPTGVGKTLAMMNFALRHCRANSLRRIIVVLPFLAISDQTEKEYRTVSEDILVDHSQKNLPDERRELAARWDAPVIITTSVRFFESLFSDRPTDCRKLHNIADSVILFDESQSLPAELASVTVKAVNLLCRKYRCSVVFSTATQPDFGALCNTEWKPREIISDPQALYRKMCRVNFEWRLFLNSGNKCGFSDIAAEMAKLNSVCAIVNLRRHARELFEELRKNRGGEGVFLLTTDLCPAHRIEVVREIRERCAAGRPCAVVATQCVEAGVDLDFDVMFRSLAPLESIVQAAGRCNRNGRLERGRVIVFEPDDERRAYPDYDYERAAMIVKNFWIGVEAPDINDPETVVKYYRKRFAGVKNKEPLEKAISKRDFAGVAEEYRLINDNGVRLIVPWSGDNGLFDEIRNADKIDRALLRKAAPITVSCFDSKFVASVATPLCFRRGKEKIETGCYILNAGFENRYDPVMGLITEDDPDDFLV